ncbi:MAG TPA: S-adenosylmethionine:tRNA ribosyltransferase-isomerase [Actinomycetota bacterium]|nr:S-adenosylmethionine:tRNA ribosyltransferase-isomerase [Actinomycetota bacterium]
MAVAPSRTTFTLPAELHATAPPEARGLRRDEVRLLVARPGAVEHARFHDVGRWLDPGDVVVVNVSETLPAAVDGIRGDGRAVTVHFSSPLARGEHVVELRAGDGPGRDAVAGEVVCVADGAWLELVAAYPDEARAEDSRLWRARLEAPEPLRDYLAKHGRPISYGYVRERWPLSAYQTIFARRPGSAEMPSAGRPFTHALVTDLVARGVVIAPVVLHTGVSSLDAHEPPLPERFEVPAPTARLVNAARAAGGRVVAVGTTVTRALESATTSAGDVVAARGVTDLVLSPERPARVVDGLVTGWHAPDASHLSLLEAVAGPELVQRAYDAAVSARYLWHEFGDSCLLLPR